MENRIDDTPNIEYVKLVRSLIEHESEVTYHRMIWTAAFHGLLFAALGFVWDKKDAWGLINTFSFLGIVVAILNTYALVMSSAATRQILMWWKDNKPDSYVGFELIGLAPKNPNSYLYFIAPWNILSLAFVCGWISVLVINMKFR
jgi:hypothetical protein